MFLSIANVINLIIEHWEISVAALAVFTSLCLGIFKGAKHGIRAIIIMLSVEILILCGFAVYKFIIEDLLGLIKFAIAWLPTIIFLIIIVLSTLTGMRRGLRKSLILFVHSVVLAGICLGLFFFCVASRVVDKWLLSLINTFMGAGELQNTLGVSAECETLREVLVEYLSSVVVDINNEFGILLGANSAYVITIINMAYRVVFAIVLFIIYELLLFIMYLIYLIFYPERRYKKKRDMRFADNKADSSYKKRPVGGGCVGLVRGLISGIISISFIGSVFFIAAGGIGASKLPEDISFGEDYEEYVSVYRSIEDYGDQGIFKVLNAIRDPEDTPYYLFAADIVFSGGLDDEQHDVSGNIKFRKELGAYTGFAKNTLALLLKYDSEGEIAAILRGEGGDDIMDKILNVFRSPEFKVEFDNLIDNFDTQTYIINFALSLADAVIANIDDMSFMESVSADNRELLKVMFKHKYNCKAIPGDIDEDPPHLTINHLFTKKDAQIVLNIVLSVIAGEVDIDQPATVARVLLPYIEDLSILSNERSSEMDPVLGRLYCYFDNKYLTDDGEEGISYAEVKNETVQWTKEIRAVLGVSDGLFTMYDKIQGSENMFSTVTSLFDEDNEDYAENVKLYEELTQVVSDSKLIGKVLNSKKISNLLRGQLKGINENVYFPEKVAYENTYDEEGNLISRGEAYQILRGLRLLADKENKELIDTLLNSSEASFEDLIIKLSETLTAPDPNSPESSLTTYFTDSVLLRSALSAVITDRAGDMLVVPNLSLEKVDGEYVNLINKKELKQIFEALPDVVNLILPLASEDVTAEHINNILVDKTFNSLLDSGNKIVEGTIAKALVNVLSDNDSVSVPQRLVNDESWEEWITVGGASGELRKGETRKFVYTVNTLQLKVDELMDGGLNSTEIFEKLKTLESDEIEELLDSGIFHYTASQMMSENKFEFDFDIIVPSSSYVYDAYNERVIRRDELASVFVQLTDFGLTSGMDNDGIVRTLIEKKSVVENSGIISASVVNFIVTHKDIRDALSIPTSYLIAGSTKNLEEYDSRNAWHGELPNMIDAIDEIFGITQMPSDAEFTFDSNAISEKTNELLQSLNKPSSVKDNLTRLEVCCESAVIRNTITAELDKTLEGVVETAVRDSAKEDGYYTKEELIALSETADIFGLEVLKIDNNNLAEKVKGQILTINDIRDDGKTALDIMYPSKIIRYFITRELDKALNGEDDTDESVIDLKVRDDFKTNGAVRVYPKKEISALVEALKALGIEDMEGVNSDRFTSLSEYKNNIDTICNSGIVTGIVTKQIDNALGEDLIERGVKNQIKGNSQAYSKEEISVLVDALDELGLDDFNRFETVKINDIRGSSQNAPGKTKLDVIYESDILVGVITKKVKDACIENENLYYHNSANRLDLSVLKHKEINALLELIGENDIDDFDLNTVSLSKVRNQLWNNDLHAGRLPNKDSAPDSYLISVNVTKSLVKNDSLYVPSSIYANDLVNVVEQLSFISALEALQSDGSFDLEVDDYIKLPENEERATILESEIMRATFSHHVFTENTGSNVVFIKTNIDVTSSRMVDRNGQTEKAEKLAVISIEQLNALFNVLDACLTEDADKKLKIPSFNKIEDVEVNQVSALSAFDVTRYNLSEIIMRALGYKGEDTQCYDFKVSGDVVEFEAAMYKLLSSDEIESIIG